MSLCLPVPALAQADAPSLRILVTTEQQVDPLYADLLLAVQARLVVLSIPATLEPVDQAADQQIAWQIARETWALSVAWLSADQTQLYFLTPVLGPQLRVRALPDASEDWVSRCEVVAAMLHAELEQVVGPAGERLPELETEAPTDQPEPDDAAPAMAALFLSGGCVPTSVNQDLPVLWGGQVAVGLRLGQRFEAQFGAEYGQPIPLDLTEQSRVARWGLRLGAALRIRLAAPVEVAPSLGVLLDLWTIRGDLGFVPPDSAVLQTQEDFAVSALLQLQLWPAPARAPRLSFFVRGGADFHTQGRSYWENRENLLVTRDGITPRLVAGIRITLDLR